MSYNPFEGYDEPKNPFQKINFNIFKKKNGDYISMESSFSNYDPYNNTMEEKPKVDINEIIQKTSKVVKEQALEEKKRFIAIINIIKQSFGNTNYNLNGIKAPKRQEIYIEFLRRYQTQDAKYISSAIAEFVAETREIYQQPKNYVQTPITESDVPNHTETPKASTPIPDDNTFNSLPQNQKDDLFAGMTLTPIQSATPPAQEEEEDLLLFFSPSEVTPLEVPSSTSPATPANTPVNVTPVNVTPVNVTPIAQVDEQKTKQTLNSSTSSTNITSTNKPTASVEQINEPNPTTSSPPLEPIEGRINRFLDALVQEVLTIKAWRGSSSAFILGTRDCFEKIVIDELRDITLGQCRTTFKEADRSYNAKIQCLSTFMSWDNFEINPVFRDENLLNQAIYNLHCITTSFSPSEKMDAIMETCHTLGQILNKKQGAGADDFLPLLIYALIRSKVINLPSTIDYIQRFCNPQILLSEPGYCLTNLAGATNFLENCKASDLCINPTVFCKYYQKARREFNLAEDHTYCTHELLPNTQTENNNVKPVSQQRTTTTTTATTTTIQPKVTTTKPKPIPKPQPVQPKVEEEDLIQWV